MLSATIYSHYHQKPLLMANTKATIESNQQKTCFVVMGFGIKTDYSTGRKLDLNKSYRLLIKPVVEKQGLECVRADEIKHSGLIDDPMYQQLFKADVVIADLSTANPNAFYELGIRHALRPRTTIIISEDKLPYPFDVNHISISKYTHLGDAIDYEEVLRFQKELGEKIAAVLESQDTDSPVYRFLNGLVPPSLEKKVNDTMQQVEQALATGQTNDTAAEDDKPSQKKDNTLAFLIEQGEAAIAKDKFQDAKSAFTMALSACSVSDKEGALRSDPYIIQRLVLATYKAKQPDKVSALNEAVVLLEGKLDLKNTNDPETLGLAGAVEKRLFEEGQGLKHLTKSIQYYSRGYYLRNDYYNGINLAFLLNMRTDTDLDAKMEEKIADLVSANRIRQDVLLLCEEEMKMLTTCEDRSKGRDVTAPEGFQNEQRAETSEQKFWLTASKAEAYYGLGNMPAYEQTKAEANSFSHAGWMIDTFQGQIDKLNALLERHGHLLNPPWPQTPLSQP
jgi:hypothetical protein